MKTIQIDCNVGMHWKGRNINQCMGNTEFLRRGGLYFAVAVLHSQLHVGETLDVKNMDFTRGKYSWGQDLERPV